MLQNMAVNVFVYFYFHEDSKVCFLKNVLDKINSSKNVQKWPSRQHGNWWDRFCTFLDGIDFVKCVLKKTDFTKSEWKKISLLQNRIKSEPEKNNPNGIENNGKNGIVALFLYNIAICYFSLTNTKKLMAYCFVLWALNRPSSKQVRKNDKHLFASNQSSVTTLSVISQSQGYEIKSS